MDPFDDRKSGVKAIRACAVFGGALWGFAAIWLLAVISLGFVNWEYANVYLSLLVITLGLSTNFILFQHAATLRRRTLITLLAVCLSLPALVAGGVVYMASG
jgi:hypothetical protein